MPANESNALLKLSKLSERFIVKYDSTISNYLFNSSVFATTSSYV